MIASRARRFMRRVLGGAPLPAPIFARISPSFERARWIVKGYYLVSIFFSGTAAVQIHNSAAAAQVWEFQWPVAWLSATDVRPAIDLIALAWMILSLLAFRFQDSRAVRILFALALLEVAAVSNSVGGVNHGYHAWLWVGVILAFLPTMPAAGPARGTKLAYLAVLAACQALLLSFYSMAGLWKIAFGVTALISGVHGNFSPDGLSMTLADRMAQTGTSPLLANFFINRPLLSQPMFLGLIYVQALSVVVFFRPRLHQAWGALIIAFHVGTWLLMEINFVAHIVLLTLFLVYSPFAPARLNLLAATADLPVLGPLANLWPSRWPGRLKAEFLPAQQAQHEIPPRPQ